MSLISFVATNKFVSIMGDGRAVEDGRVIDENFQKVFKVNDRIILAFSGSGIVPKVVMESITQFDTRNAKTFAKSLYKTIGNNQVTKGFGAFVGGLDDANRIYFSGFGNDTEFTEFNPERGSIRHGCSIPAYSEHLNVNSILERLVNKHINEYSAINECDSVKIQQEFNKLIKEGDMTVNDNLRFEQIVK